MENIDTVVQRVLKEKSQIIRVCRDLVRIPSENPPGDTTKIFAFVEKLLKRWNFPCTVFQPAPGRQNLVASWETGRAGKHLVLNAHLDTAPAGRRDLWERDPFSGDVAGGRIYGLGATDMKASVAASLFAFRYCREFKTAIVGRVTLTLVCDEQTFGEHGSRDLLAKHPEYRGDAMLSGEPGPPTIIRVGDKGRVWVEVTFRTRGGHSALPHLSESAIHQAIQFFTEIKTIEKWKSPVPVSFARHLSRVKETLDRALGKGATATARRYVVNLGVISGGTAVNSIAPQCTIQVDVRIPMGGRVAKVVTALKKAAKSCNGDLKVISTVEPSITSSDEPICQAVSSAVEHVYRKKAAFGIGLYSDDVRLWRYVGVPAAGFGPTAHNMLNPNEYVEISDLLRTTMVHSAAALQFLKAPA